MAALPLRNPRRGKKRRWAYLAGTRNVAKSKSGSFTTVPAEGVGRYPAATRKIIPRATSGRIRWRRGRFSRVNFSQREKKLPVCPILDDIDSKRSVGSQWIRCLVKTETTNRPVVRGPRLEDAETMPGI